jgi:hypothetical protein
VAVAAGILASRRAGLSSPAAVGVNLAKRVSWKNAWPVRALVAVVAGENLPMDGSSCTCDTENI